MPDCVRLGFGLTGGSFAVGIAFTSVWYSREHQGTALGIFGVGNAGAALTAMGAPSHLRSLTDEGANLEGWRTLPVYYAAALAVMAVVFFLGTKDRKVEGAAKKTLGRMLLPLKHVRVWRFGLYYFLVFGGFVALAQWLVPYYVNAYSMSIVTAGLMTSIFSLPTGVIRAIGGWGSDLLGPRRVLNWALTVIGVSCFLLMFPKMEIESPGPGVTAVVSGQVTEVSPERIVAGGRDYPLIPAPNDQVEFEDGFLPWPIIRTWQEPSVMPGENVSRRQLLASGTTHIYFQANVRVFTALVFIIGIAMGMGMAAVYKYIPNYFPEDVGVVGGIVGVLGGLGGSLYPIFFGALLDSVGLWTGTWMFLLGVTTVCLVWLNTVVRRMSQRI